MNYADDHPHHSRTSCSETALYNVDPEGSRGCERCTALALDAAASAFARGRDEGWDAGYSEGARCIATANIGAAARWRYVAENAEFVHKGHGVYMEVKLDYVAIAVTLDACVDALIAKAARS